MKISKFTVPMTRLGLGAVLVLVQMTMIPIAQAQTEGDQLTRLLACREIGAAEDRLACFDEASEILETATKSGELVTISKETVENIQKDSFGFNLPSLPKLSSVFGVLKSSDDPLTKQQKSASKAERKAAKKAAKDIKNGVTRDAEGKINTIAIPIQSLKTFGRGKTRFYLENGQIWEQTNGPDLRLRIRKSRPLVAYISRGAISGYRMRINGKGRMFTVRRTQ